MPAVPGRQGTPAWQEDTAAGPASRKIAQPFSGCQVPELDGRSPVALIRPPRIVCGGQLLAVVREGQATQGSVWDVQPVTQPASPDCKDRDRSGLILAGEQAVISGANGPII